MKEDFYPLSDREERDTSWSGGAVQASLLMAMLEPSFYPEGVIEVSHRETHISHIFFAGNLVYKLKKPVRFSFLDFSTLAKRRHFLQEELLVNARLAPSVYLGVLPISYESGGWRLGSYADPVEYVLVMRRLPERRMLDFLLDRGKATPDMMETLASTLARFHAGAKTGARISASGEPRTIRRLWDENLADIRPFVGRLLDAETLNRVQEFGERFLSLHEDLFLQRVRTGRIREVHGDLHCEHICFAPEGIQIFDAIEFSRRIRCCDVASEIAFLLMDMEFRGAGELARGFLRRYLDLSNDPELLRLLPFYKCHRALVRGKVIGLRSDGASAPAPRYFQLARRFSWDVFKPFLVMVCGLTGSGKSTLAGELSRRLGLPLLSSDATRKAIAGAAEPGKSVPWGEGLYSPAMTERTYARIAEQAEELVSGGEGAILDATFHREAQRRRIIELARRHNVPLVLIHCQSSEDLVRERLKRRAEEGRDLSDGRWEIYVKQKEAFEPVGEVSPENCRALDTAAPVEALVREAESFFLSRLKDRS
jgi:aminoglycoside phosphotransferase family enzyme/predicted kinase